jgi:hypothetical protein
MNKSICIRTTNRAEKLAALHLLSEALNVPINPQTLSQTLNNFQVLEYGYISELEGEIVGYSYECAKLIEYHDSLTPRFIREQLEGKREYRTSDDIQTVVNLNNRSVKVGEYMLTQGDLEAMLAIMSRG